MVILLWSMLFSVVMVLVTTLIHYEILQIISDKVGALKLKTRRMCMLFVVGGVFLAHTLEVWAYALCYKLMDIMNIGTLMGEGTEADLLTYVYYSTVSYTSLGLGDMFPSQGLRLLTGVEALNGLILIGWSVSFTYLMMERFWKEDEKVAVKHENNKIEAK
jgi:hypothetical protein